MKKVLWAAVVFMLAGIGFAKVNAEESEYLIKTEPCEYQETLAEIGNPGFYKGEISFEELEKDLNNLKYILETCYAGYEAAVEKGLDTAVMVTNVLKQFEGKNPVYTRDVGKAIYNELKGKIVDTHFNIALGNFVNQCLFFANHEQVYFSDLYVDDSEKEKFLIENPEVKLFPYYRENKLTNRAGIFSETDVEKIEVKVNGKKQTLLLSKYKVDTPSEMPLIKEKQTAQTAYVRFESFMPRDFKASNINIEKFKDVANKNKDKTNIIIDLRSNGGGMTKIVLESLRNFVFDKNLISKKNEDAFFKALQNKNLEITSGSYEIVSPGVINQQVVMLDMIKNNTSKKDKDYKEICIEYKKKLKCLEMLKNNPKKEYYDSYGFSWGKDYKKVKAVPFPNEPAYKGRLFILTDRNSASASELYCFIAKKYLGKNTIIIGENTLGCIEYGNVYYYTLPNSRLSFHVSAATYGPSFNTFSNWHGEGKGIYPDIWATDEDMLETIIAVTGDEGLREILKGMQ